MRLARQGLWDTPGHHPSLRLCTSGNSLALHFGPAGAWPLPWSATTRAELESQSCCHLGVQLGRAGGEEQFPTPAFDPQSQTRAAEPEWQRGGRLQSGRSSQWLSATHCRLPAPCQSSSSLLSGCAKLLTGFLGSGSGWVLAAQNFIENERVAPGMRF